MRPDGLTGSLGSARADDAVHDDALGPGHRVLLLDDVLATGGTARAAVNLVQRLGSTLHAAAFLIELDFLKGRDKLAGTTVSSVLHY